MLIVRRQRIHVSWALSWFSLALIGGIALSFADRNFRFVNPEYGIAGTAGLVVVVVKRSAAVYIVVAAIVAGLLLGLWRGENRRLAVVDYRFFIGQTVHLDGIVADDVTKTSGEAGLKLRDVQVGDVKLGGTAWAGVNTGLPLKRADQVEVTGTLRPGFGSYDASMSFAKLNTVHRVAGSDPLRTLRDRFNAGFERSVPQPEAGLGIGYLTGQHNLIPAVLVKQLQFVGLIHLVIAGGYNVTILVRLIRRAVKRVSRRTAALAAGLMMATLMVVSGFVAPMARTAIVTSLSLMTWYYGRRSHPLVLLPVAAAITALINPAFVWGDIGWYMTFVAYAGLIVVGPMLKQLFWGHEAEGELKQILIDTLAVQIATTPLMAFAFQQYSIYGLPANLLVLPCMPLTMLAVLAAGFGGMVLPASAAYWLGQPAALLLGYTDKVTVWLSNAPGAHAGASLDVRGLAVAYIVIVIFIWQLKRKVGYDFRATNLVD